MRSIIFSTTLVALLFTIVITTDDFEQSLEFVILVCRHGSRTPFVFYPNDPYRDPKYWPEGTATLTNRGKLEMYELGINLHKRYHDSLFRGRYKEEDIYVRSTQTSRTYMSVALLLAGMFPPVGHELWSTDLYWQPIPIWPDKFDKTLIVSEESLCPKFAEEQSRAINEVQDYMKKHEDLVGYLKKHSGFDIKNIADFAYIWDPITCEVARNLSLPAWTKTIYPDQLTEAVTHMYKTKITGTVVMNKLLSGPLIKDFNSWMDRKVSGSLTQKMLIHSGHDYTIFGILNALGITEIKPIKPAAALMIELHNSSEGYYIKIYYSIDHTMVKPLEVTMPKCHNPCSLEEFIKLMKEMETGDDWDAECNNRK